MNIILPKKPFSFENGAAVVEEERLYIYRPVNFYALMSDLTYAIYGRRRCFYCGRVIRRDKVTVDHKIPKCFGGPTITNNLVPSCSKCNSEKGNMFEDEYWLFRKLQGQSKKRMREFRLKVQKRQQKIYDGEIEPLPEDWLLKAKPKIITMNFFLDAPLGNGYESIKNRFLTTGGFFKPIVISSNRYLLDGINVCLYAKINGHCDDVEVIMLDNVTCMY